MDLRFISAIEGSWRLEELLEHSMSSRKRETKELRGHHGGASWLRTLRRLLPDCALRGLVLTP